MNKTIYTILGAVILGTMSPMMIKADMIRQSAQLQEAGPVAVVTENGQKAELQAPGSTDGADETQGPDGAGSNQPTDSTMAQPGGPSTAPTGQPTMAQPAGPSTDQPTVTGPATSQPTIDPAASQQPIGPGYSYSIQKKKEIGPGIPDEEFGDGTVGAASIPDNDFLDSVIVNPVVKAVEKYSYDQMAADIQSLQARYGDRIHVNVIGKSHDNRDIYEVIVGNVNAPKHILLQGAIHAREYMIPLLMMNQIETALYHYGTGHYDGKSLQEMFDQVALHFIPMSNPDGVTLSQFGLNGIRSDFLKQIILTSYAKDTEEGRTTLPIESYLTIWKSNAAGVDLNHNFAAAWESIVTSATGSSYSGYKGTSPLSEPESQALASMADRYPWAATISYHSMGNIIYWDTQTSKVKEASLSLAQSISGVTGYKLDGSDGKGGYKDWMQSKENPVPGITIEVGSVSCPLPLSEYAAVWQQNKAVWAQAMRWCNP